MRLDDEAVFADDLPVAPARPAVFETILNGDYTPNTAVNPADRGSPVMLFGTGLGAMDPPVADGSVTGGSPSKPVLPVVAEIDGRTSELLYIGAAPEPVAGVFQANLRIPDRTASGALPMVIQAGKYRTTPTLHVHVR